MKDNRSNIYYLKTYPDGFLFIYKHNKTKYASLYLRKTKYIPDYYVLSIGEYLMRNTLEIFFEQEYTKFFIV